jgi:outer membrane biosynthesis protein TonB
MDGVLLVFDSRTLPNLGELATVSGPIPDKVQRRSRMVPAFATLLLMLVIASVYYVTTARHATNDFSPASLTTPAPEPPAPVTEAPAVFPEQATEANEVQPPAPAPAEKPRTRQESAPKPAAAPARKAVTQPSDSPAKPEPKKDDSKVGSILKKTGRILKKPFKF